ncbi:MAG: carbohydrate ABC transporter permease [Candidatus Aminicenantia bacterium]
MVNRRFNLLFYVGLIFFLITIIFPFYWMIITSFKTFDQLFSIPPIFIPQKITIGSYLEVFIQHKFYKFFINSLFISLVTIFLTLIIATPGAYALTRFKFKGKGFFLQWVLITYMFPAILLVIPIFALLSKIGLHNSLVGLIMAYLVQTTPLALYLLGSYFKAIPPEIEEAALIDGCSFWQVIRKITLPLSLPSLATVAIFTFIIVWNEFLFAYVFLYSPEKYTLPIGLFHLFSSYHTAWDKIMAGSVIIVFPVIILFLFFEKYIEKGLIAGGIKG